MQIFEYYTYNFVNIFYNQMTYRKHATISFDLTRRYLSELKNVAIVFRELNGRESARSTKQQRDQTWTLMGSAI